MIVTNSNLAVLGNSTLAGTVSVPTLGAAGATHLCRNASNQISTCTAFAERSPEDGIDALKQQQEKIEQMQEQIRKQQETIDALRKIICQQNPLAEICSE